MSCEKNFVQQLRQRGLRLTPQREIVLSVLHEIDGLVTAEEIYERVHKVSSAIDISTVYRTLDLLQEFGLLTWLDLGDGQRRYEFVGEDQPHHHLRCRRCGKLIRVETNELEPLLDYLRKTHSFEAELDSMTFQGLCLECQALGCDKEAAPSLSLSSQSH